MRVILVTNSAAVLAKMRQETGRDRRENHDLVNEHRTPRLAKPLNSKPEALPPVARVEGGTSDTPAVHLRTKHFCRTSRKVPQQDAPGNEDRRRAGRMALVRLPRPLKLNSHRPRHEPNLRARASEATRLLRFDDPGSCAPKVTGCLVQESVGIPPATLAHRAECPHSLRGLQFSEMRSRSASASICFLDERFRPPQINLAL